MDKILLTAKEWQQRLMNAVSGNCGYSEKVESTVYDWNMIHVRSAIYFVDRMSE